MSQNQIRTLTRAVSDIHISEDALQTFVTPRRKRPQLLSRSTSAVVKRRSHQHRAGKGKRWGLLQEYKARTRHRLPLVVFRKEDGNRDPEERIRPRTKGPKTLQKMTLAIFWAIVESRVINHRRYPLFLPISLKVALPKKGMVFWEQHMTDAERVLMVVDDEEPFPKLKPYRICKPFLDNHPQKDAKIVWALWSESKTDPRNNFQIHIAKVFKVATEMVGDHLFEVRFAYERVQNKAWVKFVERLQKECQGMVAWPLRLTSQRFCESIFALLDACYLFQFQEKAKIQYLTTKWEEEVHREDAKTRRRREAELKPLDDLSLLVKNIREFLAAADAVDSPWIMASYPDEDDEDDGNEEYDDDEYGDVEMSG